MRTKVRQLHLIFEKIFRIEFMDLHTELIHNIMSTDNRYERLVTNVLMYGGKNAFKV